MHELCEIIKHKKEWGQYSKQPSVISIAQNNIAGGCGTKDHKSRQDETDFIACNDKALCCLYGLCEYRRHKGASKREIPMRELHGRKSRANAAQIDSHSPNRIWRRATVYGTTHRCIGNFTMEL